MLVKPGKQLIDNRFAVGQPEVALVLTGKLGGSNLCLDLIQMTYAIQYLFYRLGVIVFCLDKLASPMYLMLSSR